MWTKMSAVAVPRAFGLIFAICVLCITPSKQSEDEVRLLNNLFNATVYNKLARPVTDHNTAVDVDFSVSLLLINRVDVENDKIGLMLWLNYQWTDKKLTWNPVEYGNVESIRVSTDKIWIPDILLYNSVDEDFDSLVRHTNVVVYSDGSCSWVPAGSFEASCVFDSTWFPFDSQQCKLKFGSWTFDGHKLNLTSKYDTVDVSSYAVNTLWQLTEATATRHAVFYECCPEPYIDITCTLGIRRRSSHLAMKVFLPPSLITLIALFIFTLPVTCGERITIGTLQLISLPIFWLGLPESMMPQSHLVSLSDVYYGSMFIGSFIAFVLNIQVCKVYHKRTPMPSAFRSCISVLAKLTCVSDNGGYNNLQAMSDQPRASFDGDTARIHVNKEAGTGTVEWTVASRVLDRVFFLLFLLYFILACVMIFVSIP